MTPGTKAFWWTFIVCLCGTFLLSEIVPAPQGFGGSRVFGQDGYFEIARSLGRGDGFVFEPGGPPVFHRPPLYPLVLVPILRLPEPLLFPALVLLQSLMIGVVGALIYTIARDYFGIGIARAALAVFLANPWLYANARNPQTPAIQCLLYTIFIFLLLREVIPALRGKPAPAGIPFLPLWLLLGTIGGLLSLTHGTLIAVNCVSFGMLFLFALYRRHTHLLRTALFGGVFSLLVVAPWTFRNWVTFHRFVPVVGGGGLMLGYSSRYWHGPDSATSSMRETAGIPKRFHGLPSEDLDVKANSAAVEQILSSPGMFAKGLILNAAAYYFPYVAEVFRPSPRSDYANREKMAVTCLHAALWFLAGVGFWRARANREQAQIQMLLFLAICLYAVWYFPFLTSVNHTMYVFATTQFLAILAAVGLVQFRVRELAKTEPGHDEDRLSG